MSLTNHFCYIGICSPIIHLSLWLQWIYLSSQDSDWKHNLHLIYCLIQAASLSPLWVPVSQSFHRSIKDDKLFFLQCVTNLHVIVHILSTHPHNSHKSDTLASTLTTTCVSLLCQVYFIVLMLLLLLLPLVLQVHKSSTYLPTTAYPPKSCWIYGAHDEHWVPAVVCENLLDSSSLPSCSTLQYQFPCCWL